MSEVQSIFQISRNEVLTSMLNIQSVNAKFNHLCPVIKNIVLLGLYFKEIDLVQDTWNSSDSNRSLLLLPGYQLVYQGSKCTKHSGW